MRKYVFAFIVIVLAVSVCLNIGMYRHINTEAVKSDTVYKEIIVEVRDSAPVVKEDKTIGQISVPVYSNSLKIGKNKHDSTCLSGQKSDDKRKTGDSVTLDIVQRKYTDDSTYTAYVSGLRYDIYSRLDSVIVRQRTVTERVRHTVTLRPKSPRWNVGLIGGYGYGFKSKNLEPFIGVGVTISLIGG